MKQATIDRIIYNASLNRKTVIGRYTYTANLNTGEIKRCLTEDIDKQWIDSDGNRRGPWETI